VSERVSGRVLVVDDERDIADSLKAGLQMKGFTVDVFYDPVEALSHFRRGVYDLVISDIKMPKMNGFELVYELEKIDDNVRVIFLTGFVDMLKELTMLFPKLHVNEIIQKPIGIKDLVNKISTLDVGTKAKVAEPK
jgi:DNA-binding response OmpR family regulator